ncbi:MAG: hypothetical protein Tsb0021_16870 [Chlamydiales bacterium]
MVRFNVNGLKINSILPPISRRNYCSSQNSQNKKALLILGNSNIGHWVARKGIDLEYNVFVTTRSEVSQNSGRIKYIQTPSKMQDKPFFWKNIVKKEIPDHSHLLVVNTIGNSVADQNQTIETINVKIPVSAIYGISKAAKTKFNSYNIVHLSTTAADLETPYGKARRIAEQLLMDISIEPFHLTILRASYVVEPLFMNTITQIYKPKHSFSAEQFSSLFFTPLLGNRWDYKKVKLQPVSIHDLTKAIFNTVPLSIDHPNEKRLINAVGREAMTQEDLFKFFTDLRGKKFGPVVYIPIKVARIMAKHHPFGHCDLNAVELCAEDRIERCHKDFERLIGSPPKTMEETYHEGIDKESILIIPKPPLLTFATQILKNIFANPSVLPDTLIAIYHLAKSIVWDKEQPSLEFKERPSYFKIYRYKFVTEKNFNQNSLKNRINNLK